METRSNWLKVSLVVGLLITAVIGFTLWLIQSREADGATYEVQFKQSVDGVQIGSGVNLLGVPVGKVSQRRAWWDRSRELRVPDRSPSVSHPGILNDCAAMSATAEPLPSSTPQHWEYVLQSFSPRNRSSPGCWRCFPLPWQLANE